MNILKNITTILPSLWTSIWGGGGVGGGHSVSQTQFLEFTLFSEHIFLNHIYSSHAISNFYRLLITFANSLDLNQDRPKVDPDLGPNCLTL